jgi:soluble lytic murein transglycosylase-like protein
MLQPSEYRPAIMVAAQSAGIDPAVALAVARRESGTAQFLSDGSLKRGAAGEVGIFQIMPATAPGEDLSDPATNIRVGVNYLAQLYRQFGNWPQALAAYNWGPTRETNALRAGRHEPASVARYEKAILGTGADSGTTLSARAGNGSGGHSVDWTFGLIAAGALLFLAAL